MKIKYILTINDNCILNQTELLKIFYFYCSECDQSMCQVCTVAQVPYWDTFFKGIKEQGLYPLLKDVGGLYNLEDFNPLDTDVVKILDKYDADTQILILKLLKGAKENNLCNTVGG